MFYYVNYIYNVFVLFQSYVACLIGAQKIPLILLSTSALQCVAALTFGLLLQHVRRLHIMSKYKANLLCLISHKILHSPLNCQRFLLSITLIDIKYCFRPAFVKIEIWSFLDELRFPWFQKIDFYQMVCMLDSSDSKKVIFMKWSVFPYVCMCSVLNI